MPDYINSLDSVFRALADPTRRAVIRRLARGKATVSELSEPFDMALQSFLQHLKVLEDSGLIVTEKSGRVRSCQIAPQQLDGIEDWLSELRLEWESRLERLDEYLEQTKNKEK